MKQSAKHKSQNAKRQSPIANRKSQITNHKSQITNHTIALSDERTIALKIDRRTRRVWKGEQELRLTRLEYEVLKYLAQRAGQVVTYQELWREVWRQETALEDRERLVVRQLVKRLRAKLGEDWKMLQLLVCVRGVGFRFEINRITLVE
jgi:DNA-binding response OmpR family regulator